MNGEQESCREKLPRVHGEWWGLCLVGRRRGAQWMERGCGSGGGKSHVLRGTRQ